jgi:hypothetical protein
MRVKGIKIIANEQQIAITIQRHTGKSLSESTTIARRILDGASVEFNDDWALEQDLKELGVKF